jgi:hypothetical protein
VIPSVRDRASEFLGDIRPHAVWKSRRRGTHGSSCDHLACSQDLKKGPSSDPQCPGQAIRFLAQVLAME